MYSLLESSVRQTKIDKFKIIMKKVSSLTLNSYPIISLLRPAILVKKDIHNTGPIDISHEHALKRVYMQHLSNGMDQHCNFAIRSIAKTGLQRSVHVEQNRIHIYMLHRRTCRNVINVWFLVGWKVEHTRNAAAWRGDKAANWSILHSPAFDHLRERSVFSAKINIGPCVWGRLYGGSWPTTIRFKSTAADQPSLL